jgi:hypothetical protein
VCGRVTTDCMGMPKTSIVNDGAADVEEVVAEPATNPRVLEDLGDSGAHTSCSGTKFCHVSSAGAVTSTLEIGSES